MQMGHHADCTLRSLLNETFADLYSLSYYSDLTRDALRDLDFSPYKILGMLCLFFKHLLLLIDCFLPVNFHFRNSFI